MIPVVRRLAITVLMTIALGAMDFAASAAQTNQATLPAVSSVLEDQTGLALTIYNVNLGLVKDQRQIRLGKGTGELRFMDVASQIIPASVHITSLVDADSLLVLEQNYE
jgi:hypothetical protein